MNRIILKLSGAFAIVFYALIQNCAADDFTQNWGLGLSEFDNQFPLALNHASFRTISPKVVGEKNYKLRASYSVSNTYIQEKGKYIIDGEYRVTNIETTFGVSEHLEVTARIPFVWRGDGYLDSFVDDFHKTFGFPRGDRRDDNEDQFGIVGKNQDESGFAILETGLDPGDITLASKYLLTAGSATSSGWSMITELRLPTASKESYGQDSVDLTLGLVGSKAISPLYLYWGTAYIFYGDTETSNITYERHHAEGFVGAEYPLSDSFSFNAAFYLASPLIESIDGFPRYSLYLDTGLKYKFSERNVFEFLLRENPTPSGSTADFTILFGIQHSIGN